MTIKIHFKILIYIFLLSQIWSNISVNYTIFFSDTSDVVVCHSSEKEEDNNEKKIKFEFEKKFEDKILFYTTFINLSNYKVKRNFLYKEVFFAENYLTTCTPPPEFS